MPLSLTKSVGNKLSSSVLQSKNGRKEVSNIIKEPTEAYARFGKIVGLCDTNWESFSKTAKIPNTIKSDVSKMTDLKNEALSYCAIDLIEDYYKRK